MINPLDLVKTITGGSESSKSEGVGSSNLLESLGLDKVLNAVGPLVKAAAPIAIGMGL